MIQWLIVDGIKFLPKISDEMNSHNTIFIRTFRQTTGCCGSAGLPDFYDQSYHVDNPIKNNVAQECDSTKMGKGTT